MSGLGSVLRLSLPWFGVFAWIATVGGGCRSTGALHPEAVRQHKVGSLYLQNGKYSVAEKHLLRAVEVDARMAPAYDKLGLIQMERGLFRAAEGYFRMAIKHQGKFSLAYDHLGLALRAQRQYNKAMGAFRKALSYQTSLFSARLHLAQTYRRVERYKDAEKECFQLITENPRRHEPHHELGLLYLAQGKKGPAIASFKRSTKRNARAISPHFQLGKIYLDKGKFCLAYVYLQRVLSLDIRHPEARKLYTEAKVGLKGASCADTKIE